MNTQISLGKPRPSLHRPELSFEDKAFVRIASAILEAPEEVILASLLAARPKKIELASN